MGVPRFWREIRQRYDIVGNKCTKCGRINFPQRSVCPKCFNMEFDTYDLKPEGTISSFTVIHVPQEGFEDETPYVMAIIKLADGPSITAQIVDCDASEVGIGKKVSACFRRIYEDGLTGVISYSYKFKLAEKQKTAP